MTATTNGTDTGSVVHAARSGRVPWLALIAAVAVLAVIGAWYVFADDGSPTMTFDGESAVYDGPMTFDAGEVTFVFDASEYEPGVAMIIGALNDDSITIGDVRDYAVDTPASAPVPPFVKDFNVFYLTDDDPDARVVERTIELESDTRYLLTANTSQADTDRAHPAAIIEAQ